MADDNGGDRPEALELEVSVTTSDEPDIGAAVGAQCIADRLVDLEQY